MSSISSRLPEIVSTLKVLKNVVALAPLGEHVAAGIDLAISICEMAEVRYYPSYDNDNKWSMYVVSPEGQNQQGRL
jgi:hypothetical protein